MKKRYLLVGVLGLFLSVSSCKKIDDFGTTNDSPNGTSVPNVAGLMTNVQSAVGSYSSTTAIALNGAQYVQYFSQTQYPDVSLYSNPQVAFTGHYSGLLFDLQNITQLEESTPNTIVVAKVLQQYIFWKVTDAWGDVPYSEALKGLNNVSPKYDTQEDIYKGILSTLKSALTQFDGSGIQGDIIYNGNVANWKRFVNSLRMIVALQLSKKFPAPSGFAATEFKDALADGAGYITANAQNFALKYPGGGYKNPFYNLYDGRSDYGESKTLTDLTAKLGDARQAAFGGASSVKDNNTTSNVGVPYGVKKEDAEAFTSANPTWARVLRGDFRSETSVLNMITASQVALARAEARDYGWTTEDLNAVYQAGVALSYEQWGVGTPAATYFTNGDVVLAAAAGSGANLKNISIQRYLASYPDGHQGWNIWRKSGFPVLTPAKDGVSSPKEIVQRFTHASTESTTNGVNYKAAMDRLPGGDKQNSKVWWNQ